MNNAAPADKLKNTPEESESLNSQAFSARLAEFEQNLANRRKWTSIIQLVRWHIAVVFPFLYLVSVFAHSRGHEFEWWRGLWLPALSVLSFCWLAAERLRSDWADLFESVSDKRAIGILIDVISLRNRHTAYDPSSRKSAKEALIRLLLNLQPSDDDALTAAQRTSLANIATIENDIRLVNAIIEALGKFGRGESVRSLETLAEWKAKYKGEEARGAALAALILVRERAEQDKAHSVLLRPSEDGPNEGALLVRPSIVPVPLDSSTLLRSPEEQEIHRVGS